MGNHRLRIGVAVVAVGLLATSCTATPDEPSQQADRVITVLTATDEPIIDATVMAADWRGVSTEFRTDEAGQVQLPSDVRWVQVSIDAPNMVVTTSRQLNGTVALQDDPLPADSDGDGLSDGEEALLGTGPHAPDTDSDGISDGDESRVVSGFAPTALGASPLRRDMFVEIDWWEGFGELGQFTQGAAALVAQVFTEGSTLINPDGSRGVRVHIDRGQFGGGSAFSLPEGGVVCYPSPPDPLRSEVAPERRAVFFHISVVSTAGCGYSGIAVATRSVFVNPVLTALPLLRDVSWAGLAAHELGHSVGLLHGGADDINCKPNYPSVMNYDLLPMTIMASMSFSRGLQGPIDELAVVESDPLLIYPNYDFNNNGIIEDVPYARDLNNGKWANPLLLQATETVVGRHFETVCASFESLDVLRDHDDWATIDQNLSRVVGLPLGEGAWFPGWFLRPAMVD